MRISLLSLICLLFWNCATQTKVTETAEVSSKTKLLTELSNQKLDYTALRFKARVSADFGKGIPDLNGTIYSEKGEKIWLNISKFGLSFARALADRSEFQAYVKIDRSYYKDSYSSLDALLGLPFLDLEKMEMLLFGRFMFSNLEQDMNYSFSNNQHLLNFNIKVPAQNQVLQVESRFNALFQQTNTRINIPAEATVVEVFYSEWVEQGRQVFPMKVKILIKNKETKQLELDYSNFEFEKMETPFRIPNGYTQKQIK